MEKPTHIAVFASGSGSNAERLIQHFKGQEIGCVKLVVHNRKAAGVVERAKRLNVACLYVPKKELGSEAMLNELRAQKIDLIVLAGFLVKIPTTLLEAFPDRILNIHPSLLPDFGGKGMYGMNVHRAVIKDAKKESGISIHLVNEEYDKGRILAQFNCVLDDDETPESLQKKVQMLEHTHFPNVVEQYMRENAI